MNQYHLWGAWGLAVLSTSYFAFYIEPTFITTDSWCPPMGLYSKARSSFQSIKCVSSWDPYHAPHDLGLTALLFALPGKFLLPPSWQNWPFDPSSSFHSWSHWHLLRGTLLSRSNALPEAQRSAHLHLTEPVRSAMLLCLFDQLISADSTGPGAVSVSLPTTSPAPNKPRTLYAVSTKQIFVE